MKKKNFLVKRLARNVQVMNQDLRREFGLNPSADTGCSSSSSSVFMPICSWKWQRIWWFLFISTSPTRRGVLPWISSWMCATPGSPQSKAS